MIDADPYAQPAPSPRTPPVRSLGAGLPAQRSRPEGGLPADEAMAAVRLGLWVSAARCVLTYVVAPALGAIGVVLGPVGLVLQILGVITSVSGARRLHALRHRLRHVYTFVAAAIVLGTLMTLAQLFS